MKNFYAFWNNVSRLTIGPNADPKIVAALADAHKAQNPEPEPAK